MRPTTLALISLVTGTILILILAFAFHTEEVLALGGVAFLWFLLSGVINFPLGRFFEYTSVNLTGVSRTATIIGAAAAVRDHNGGHRRWRNHETHSSSWARSRQCVGFFSY